MSSDARVVLAILEPALQFVQKCPVDSKIIDRTFPTMSCPICGTAYCMSPCVEKLATKNKKCPTCKKFEMNKLVEIIQNITYRARLEELKASRRVSDHVYDKLRVEYETRQREAVARVYGKGSQKDGERDKAPLRCDHCGKETNYIAQYNRWYCYKCGRYLPVSK